MFKEIQITPLKRQARGRNGFFTPVRIDVNYFGNACIYIQVYSRRKGQLAPIILPVGLFDALELGGALVEVAKHSRYLEEQNVKTSETVQGCA